MPKIEEYPDMWYHLDEYYDQFQKALFEKHAKVDEKKRRDYPLTISNLALILLRDIYREAIESESDEKKINLFESKYKKYADLLLKQDVEDGIIAVLLGMLREVHSDYPDPLYKKIVDKAFDKLRKEEIFIDGNADKVNGFVTRLKSQMQKKPDPVIPATLPAAAGPISATSVAAAAPAVSVPRSAPAPVAPVPRSAPAPVAPVPRSAPTPAAPAPSAVDVKHSSAVSVPAAMPASSAAAVPSPAGIVTAPSGDLPASGRGSMLGGAVGENWFSDPAQKREKVFAIVEKLKEFAGGVEWSSEAVAPPLAKEANAPICFTGKSTDGKQSAQFFLHKDKIATQDKNVDIYVAMLVAFKEVYGYSRLPTLTTDDKKTWNEALKKAVELNIYKQNQVDIIMNNCQPNKPSPAHSVDAKKASAEAKPPSPRK